MSEVGEPNKLKASAYAYIYLTTNASKHIGMMEDCRGNSCFG